MFPNQRVRRWVGNFDCSHRVFTSSRIFSGRFQLRTGDSSQRFSRPSGCDTYRPAGVERMTALVVDSLDRDKTSWDKTYSGTKRPETKHPETKRTMDKTSFGQNVQWDKTSSGTKRPRRQNILKTKCPAGQNVLRDKTSFYQFCFRILQTHLAEGKRKRGEYWDLLSYIEYIKTYWNIVNNSKQN
jgi:hypothetical protein